MDHFRMNARNATLIVSCAIGTAPSILYWGGCLGAHVSIDDVVRLTTRQSAPGVADVVVMPSLAMEPGLGFCSVPGFSAHADGQHWASLFLVERTTATATQLHIQCKDHGGDLRLDYRITVDALTGTFTLGTTLTNSSKATLDLAEMATACLPIPQSMTDIIGFTGRWAQEFQTQRLSRFAGTYLRENRRGRTSHDSFPALTMCGADTNETTGEAYGFHLAWSGNHRVRVDTLFDGRVLVSLGALLLPGEMRLVAGQQFVSPDIVASYSNQGLSKLSQNFHTHVRENLLRPSTRTKPRPVHYNTWEAVYFNHDIERLKLLADKAADLGVERFVLDDGWFGTRRHDRAGLGDWVVSRDVYPDGLGPLVDHVTGLGMEMGIWFEPEMVNVDSELYRTHPDWVLGAPGIGQIPFRHQLVLDISRPEVSDHVFEQIDAVLSDYQIGYVKWDMNRDHNHPGDHQGLPRSHAQVAALYALLDRIRAKHPDVEIESCSSGGARADYGALAHTDRVWTSDSNDAIDRQSIQRGASYFLPLDVMGAHVGPRRCHITGRTLSMAMRAGTAVMGHMGLELNLLEERAADLDELKAAIALYKEHRALLHHGTMVRLDAPSHLNCVGVISPDQREAIYSVAFLTSHLAVLPDKICFDGLNPDLAYQLKLIWPRGWTSPSKPSVLDALDLRGDGAVLSGAALMKIGLQLPLSLPETVLLFHVTATAP
jgi:alpha-galactosidase